MKGIYRDGYYGGSIELRDVFNRRCVKCGRGHFVQAKTMGIRTGVVFWNLVFSLMFTCVKGTTHCSNFGVFSNALLQCVCVLGHDCARACVHACVRAQARSQKRECSRRAQMRVQPLFWVEFFFSFLFFFLKKGAVWRFLRSMRALTEEFNRDSCGSLRFF